MEIDKIIYKAKDGRTFFDPIQCQEYEKKIGIIEGSVGDLISRMEKEMTRDHYIFGIVKVMNGDKSYLYSRCTVCVDCKLEDYVNVNDLQEESRYVIAKAGELIDTMKQLDKDLPCQWFILFSEDINFKAAAAMANYNKNAWNNKI